ncbi:hypothetical protein METBISCDRAFT_23280 [Metschnikowia bicuspidata]|uniref:C2H2-type domain-containing protein n=1 Tax=Metschnikowia bicuspidata TaxID=27322 RepID=A0A4P9ZDK7_9ASCO|nr:hypothetical protein METBISCDRAFT_23280 [Metschnikowia bicuspidata]
MLSVGLYLAYPDQPINALLLKGTISVSEYLRRYVFRQTAKSARSVSKTDGLFPRVCQSEIHIINNSLDSMAKVCAADDFELPFFGESPQIDMLEDHGVAQFQNLRRLYSVSCDRDISRTFLPAFGKHGHDHMHFYDSKAVTVPAFSALDDTLVITQFSSQKDPRRLDAFQHPLMVPEMGAKQLLRYVHIQNQPCPKMEMTGDYARYSLFRGNHQDMAQLPFLSDLKHSQMSESFSCQLSVDSLDSTLDEIFSKNPLPNQNECVLPQWVSRNRRNTSPPVASSVRVFSSEIKLPASYKMEKFKKVKSELSKLVANSKLKDDEDNLLRFRCPHCESEFRVRSYLTRHLRKHTNAMAYVCPFYQDDDEPCGEKAGAKCHPTGGFSRKDTFKTHLRALHFIYPPRTRSKERSTLGGRCAGCFQYFHNNTVWLQNHIEPGLCPGFVSKKRAGAGGMSIKQDSD